ncbi:MAG: SbcC/MukB-like Walker B domain-containing protein [Alicyclobacillaceae bacterium]|nr:SbcC/MukB-like Walker B domain-containing protein [Alicyclobacillaceae bacterium]
MKRLRRLLLINWHYIVKAVLEFGTITFLTGKNGAGKSTVIDALQLLILGDTSGHFFNKAASGQSRRTLKGYLRGEVGEEEEGRVAYLREGAFSSYIVGEFEDVARGEFFCLGVVFDSYPDGGHDHRFFSLSGPLPDFHFVKDGVPLDITALRQWGQLHMRGKFEMYESNKRYQEMFLAKMGRLSDRFFRLFRKAVPFSPILDVAGFISEFVCDVQHQVDIEDMRENIRHYRRMEQELEAVKRRIAALEEVERTFAEVEAADRRLAVYGYLLERARLHQAEERAAQIEAQVGGLNRDLAALEADISREEQSLEELRERRDRLIQERASSSQYLKEQELRRRMEMAETQAASLIRDVRRVADQWIRHRATWDALAAGLREWGSGEPGRAGSEEDAAALAGIAALYREAAALAGEAAGLLPAPPDVPADVKQGALLQIEPSRWRVDGRRLVAVRERMEPAAERLREGAIRFQQVWDGWREEREARRKAAEELRRGIKQYEPAVIALRDLLRRELSERYGRDIPVHVFSDLLEIRDETWQRAIEGYLHTQRFYLLVAPEYFVDALKIYDAAKKERKLYDVGLVDTGRILEQKPEVLPGSLAEEIATDDPLARAYADYLLGRVMKCDRVEDLRLHRTAITRDGMLYQNFVARQLNPKRWETLFIGRRAVEQQLAQTLRRLEELDGLLSGWEGALGRAKHWAAIPVLSEEELRDAERAEAAVQDLIAVQREYREAAEALGRLDLSDVWALGEEIRRCEEEMRRADERLRAAQKSRGALEERRRLLAERELPEAIRAAGEQRRRLQEAFDPAFARDEGEPRFEQELRRLGSAEAILQNFGRQKAVEENRRIKNWEQLVLLRERYNREFQAGFDIHRPDNEAYRQEWRRLTESQLTEYEQKIREAKERAQIQFKEDFVSKLRGNIEMVKEQIAMLNDALRQFSFGRVKYQFSVTANPRYKRFYDMIMDDLLVEGYSLFSLPFQERYGEVLDELFRHIVDVDEADPAMQTQLEKNLELFTDYRTYLDFDLVETDEEGRTSRLSRAIVKKSGGETQTPFYISVLASFAQVYRVNQPGHDFTLRLIVFDEAYNKMDHQRIRESLRLVRKMGLQAVISAPTEKIPDVAPLADRTLLVTRVRQDTRIDPFNPDEEVVEDATWGEVGAAPAEQAGGRL